MCYCIIPNDMLVIFYCILVIFNCLSLIFEMSLGLCISRSVCISRCLCISWCLYISGCVYLKVSVNLKVSVGLSCLWVCLPYNSRYSKCLFMVQYICYYERRNLISPFFSNTTTKIFENIFNALFKFLDHRKFMF